MAEPAMDTESAARQRAALRVSDRRRIILVVIVAFEVGRDRGLGVTHEATEFHCLYRKCGVGTNRLRTNIPANVPYWAAGGVADI
jgi:hypothetical protein